MAFVNDNQQLVPPLEIGKISFVIVLLQATILQIRMKSHEIIQVIPLELGIMPPLVLPPVLLEFLGTQDHSGITLRLEILDNRQRRKGFTQADCIGQNSPVVPTEHLDERDNAFLLIVKKGIPDDTGLKE